MSEDNNSESLLEVYLFENKQLLDDLQQIVLEQKDEECFDDEAINEIFRTMHTIKGSSGMMMFDEVTAAAHKLEDVFFYLRESHPENVPHIELVEHVLSVADFISGEMEKIENGDAADGKAEDILKELDKFLDKIKGEGAEEETPKKQEEIPAPMQYYIAPVATEESRFFKVYITFTPGTELVNIHAYKVVFALKEIAEDLLFSPEDIISDDSSIPIILSEGFRILLRTQKGEEEIRKIIGIGYDIKAVDVYECTAADYKMGFDSVGSEIRIDLDSSVEEIEGRAKEAEEKKKEPVAAEPTPGDFVIQSKEPGKGKKLAKEKPKKGEKASFISVEVSKMDMLMDLIGELVISESVVLQNPDLKVPGLKLDNFNKAAAQMSKISTDLQNVIMSMRMMPLTNTFQKMNRIVFDVSRKLGKDIEFEMQGDGTEVDKNIIEQISDPLMHLVRNAVDHGIETNEERAAKGKTEHARVTLTAKTESGKVWITVKDNGKGLDREKIIAKARRQGLLDYAKADNDYSDKEIYQFITLPGFSTNEKVTEYSGRGVGMDVVVSNLQKIGGSLEIESVPGEGSSMIMKIPLTLAIIDGIVMEVGNSSFVIESSVVREFVNLQENAMIHESNGSEFIMLRGECYPILRLSEFYHLENSPNPDHGGMMLVLEIDDNTVCMFVDKLVGNQEIVVKPIPSYVKKVKGLSGCTQLGDGSIALILDPAGLVE